MTGIDPVELRMRNLIRPERMPFARGTTILGEEVEYDSGDYPHALAEAASLSGFPSRVRSAARDGEAPDGKAPAGKEAGGRPAARYRSGWGLACFVEKTGTGPFEGARACLDRSGALVIATGAADLGQGLETCLAQIAGDALGVDHAGITVRHGDTDLIPHGVGSFASRGTVMAGNAVHTAVTELRTRLLERAAARLETAAGDLVIEADGVVRGAGGGSCTLADLAAEPGLETVHYFRCERMAYSHGVAVARVRVDTATGLVVPDRICSCTMSGASSIRGSSRGRSRAGSPRASAAPLLEELRYDDAGQFLSGSFMDYLLPGTTDVPSIVHRDLGGSPSPRNPLGVKGAGEVGIAGIGGAIANAVADALGDAEGDSDRLPLTPERVWARARAMGAAGSPGSPRAPGAPAAGAGAAAPA